MQYRPVILLGAGCRNNPELVKRVESWGVPVCTTWMGADLLPQDSPVYVGRPGVFGQRAANIIIQKATYLLCLGARLDMESVAFNYRNFAKQATVTVIDTDVAELMKVQEYVRYVTEWVDLSQPEPFKWHLQPTPEWLAWCRALYREFYPELIGHERDDGFVDPNYFIHQLSEHCTDGDVLSPCSSGVGGISFMQGFEFKRGQRMTCCASIGAMGMDIPMAIGACLASGRKRTICVTGDGGFMLNVQELEVVRRLNLPIKFFVYDNGGYGSIRAMQDGRFGGNRVGCDAGSGLTLPDLREVAASYKIVSYNYDTPEMIDCIWKDLFVSPEPIVIILKVDPAYQQLPRITSSLDAEGHWHPDSFEDMTPKLDKEKLEAIMSW